MRENLLIAMTTILISILIISFIVGLFAIINFGWSNSERAECERWAEDAEKYTGFYITQWQADQCDFRDVEINAPVNLYC